MIKTLLLVVSLSSPFAVADNGGHIQDLRGKVTLTRSGKSEPATKGAAFSSQDLIETGKNSSAFLQLEDGTQLKLGPGTRLTPLELKGDIELKLESGSVISKVTPRKPGQHFSMRTSSAVMGVRGTQFYTGYNENSVWMCVHEGEVEIENLADHGKAQVPAGKGVKVQDGKMTPPEVVEWTKKINWGMKPDNEPSPWD